MRLREEHQSAIDTCLFQATISRVLWRVAINSSTPVAKHKIRVNVVCSGAIGTAVESSTKKRGVEKAEEPVE